MLTHNYSIHVYAYQCVGINVPEPSIDKMTYATSYNQGLISTNNFVVIKIISEVVCPGVCRTIVVQKRELISWKKSGFTIACQSLSPITSLNTTPTPELKLEHSNPRHNEQVI